ncbi:MAG: hypothetical protein ACJ8AM_14165 [Gemmatimonadales bacterium]
MGKLTMPRIALLATGLIGAWSQSHGPCSAPRLLPAYAHNDYYNRHPLEDGLALGFQGVEADYILVNGRLLVAHSRRDARETRTLEGLYLAPLRLRIQHCGWVQSPEQAFLLNIKSKENSLDGYRVLRQLLRSYADLFGTRDNPGPVRAVLVGWHPSLSQIAADSGPLIAVQARITRSGLELPEGDTTLIGMVSLDYGETMRWKGQGELTQDDRRTLERIKEVHRLLPGRTIRAYDVPPDSAVYHRLLQAGVDLIGLKDLQQGQRLAP